MRRAKDASLRGQGFTAETGALYVLRSARGRGVGSALKGATAKVLTAWGHQATSLWVPERNGQARRFRERLGGKVVGHQLDRREDTILDEVAHG